MTSLGEKPLNPAETGFRCSNTKFFFICPEDDVAAMVRVWGLAFVVSSHRKAQCPFCEIWVFASPTFRPRTRKCAPFKWFPCSRSIGLGIWIHQFGGSILSTQGPEVGSTAQLCAWVNE